MKKATLFAMSAAALICGIVPAQGDMKKKAELPAVTSKFPVKFYGYIKLDASWDDSRMSVGNFARWVEPESAATTEEDSETNITANQSRFGLDVSGPTVDGIQTGAKVEVDFYGGGAENKSNPRMRHAYVWAKWEEHGLKLVAGQTWDLVGNGNFCDTLNLNPAWWVGNIGFRRPQLSLHKTWTMDGGRKLDGGIGIFRTIGDATALSPGDTGEDSDLPTIQGRIALTTPLFDKAGPAVFALSGHFGTEEYDTAVDDQNEDMDSWSFCFDFKLPVNKNFTFNGCYWMGENVDDFAAGIGQGVNATTVEEIASTGGFFQCCMHELVKDWKFSVGFGFDDPDDDDLAVGGRDKNMLIYGNAQYYITPELMAGVELSWWETEYKVAPAATSTDGDAIRIQFSVKYTF